MTNFVKAAKAGSKQRYVDPADYKHQFEVNHVVSADPKQPNRDSLRLEAKSTVIERLEDTCNNKCALVRNDVASFTFSISLGQPSEYYARKSQQLDEIQKRIVALRAGMDVLKLGVPISDDVVVGSV